MTLTLTGNTGAARMAHRFAAALVNRGHQVVLIHGPSAIAVDGSPAETVLPDMKNAGLELRQDDRLVASVSPRLVRSLAKTAKQMKAHAIIGVNQHDRPIAVKAAALAGISGLISVQNQHRFWGPAFWANIKRGYYSSCVRRFTRLAICTSEQVASELTNEMNLPRDRIEILQNGVDARNFPTYPASEIIETRRSFGADGDMFLWVNVGRIDYQKGQDILIEAAARLRSLHQYWKIVCIGDVTSGTNKIRMKVYFSQLKQRVSELNLQNYFVFAGWRSDVAKLLASADAYVHSARYEGSPLSVLEAMAAQRPIVTPENASRPPGFIHNQHGLVVRPGDINDLAEKMHTIMCASPDEKTRLSTEARRLAVNEYDISAVAARFVELVEMNSGPYSYKTKIAGNVIP